MQDTGLILRDIHDLDAVPWWPLAQGWWWLFVVIMLIMLVAGIRYWIRYSGIMPGWRGDARRQLRGLKKAVRNIPPRAVAGNLSELLRRIAMARSDRREAAGLTGDEWLVWLEQNDSSGFKWTRRGKVLLQAPYMPPDRMVSREEIQRLIVAALRWVDTALVSDAKKTPPWLEKITMLRKPRAGGTANV